VQANERKKKATESGNEQREIMAVEHATDLVLAGDDDEEE